MKLCSKCKVEKSLNSFTIDRSSRDGLHFKCKDCLRQYREENRERNNKKMSEIYYANRDRYLENCKQYRAVNKEALNAKKRAYKKEKSGLINSINARRNALKLNATPVWADTLAIKRIYKEAAELSKITGIEFHVDHIIPLKGKNVTGLHVESNLRIISKTENLKKKNKLIEELAQG